MIISEKIEGKIINVKVSSTNISRVTYDTESNFLTIIFNNGNIYEYYDVEWQIFTKFRMSESQGKFFNEFIKNKYKYKKIG